ncbi:MAG: phytanoyl-CoA dioxygenase family protein [Ilumatobacteraceae bacterium]
MSPLLTADELAAFERIGSGPARAVLARRDRRDQHGARRTDGRGRAAEHPGEVERGRAHRHGAAPPPRTIRPGWSAHLLLLAPALQVLGDVPVYAQQVKVNAKAALTGEQWQWHYDFATHHHEDGVPEPLALNVHLFLDDVTEFNGPLMFVRGSHRDGPAPTSLDTETTSFDLWTVDADVVGPLAERGGLISPKGPAGTVLLFGDAVVHASPPNMSPWPRRIFSLIVNPVSNRQTTERRADHFHHRDATPLDV